MLQKNSLVATVVAVAALGGVAGFTTAGSPAAPTKPLNVLKNGDIPGTMAQARQLMDALRTNDWDPAKIDRSLTRVPDQEYAQDPMERTAMVPTFWCTVADPYYKDEVAFWSKLYVQRNFEVVPGIEGKATYNGFFIVGFRDGRIEQVPVGETRVLWERGSGHVIFPGMARYTHDLPIFGQARQEGPVATKASKTK